MKTINEMSIIFNINMMRKQITGCEMDLDNLHLYDVNAMNYNQLYELQNNLIPAYNKSLLNK
jgi:hypothetical protein